MYGADNRRRIGGGFMKRLIACALLLFISCICAFCGDAAVFHDIGFSEDGKTYVFGEYGKTDKDYQAWAEIYTVDVAKNDFIKDDVYKTVPSPETTSISGKASFDQLYSKVEWKLAKYKCTPVDASTLLYIRQNENKGGTEQITFKDFEGLTDSSSLSYQVKLVPTFNGSGKNCSSSFYINISATDENGNTVKSFRAGTPSVKRKGITSYVIDRIFTDKTGSCLVFVVQKILEDDKGSSIRYMVETVSLKNISKK